MPDVTYRHHFKPKLKLVDDTLFVCAYTGIYKKNLRDNTDWELYAFENVPVKEFVRNGDKLLAISTGKAGLYSPYENTDSLLLLSNDNGRTFINFTSPHFFQYEDFNHLYRIAQNPENPNSILISQACYGISKSDDFGTTWRTLTDENMGFQDWDLTYHPSDTTIFFHTGELMYFDARIRKFYNDGETWFDYQVPNHCIHSLAFHPTNPDVLVYCGEGQFGKSADRGETYQRVNTNTNPIYFYKVLFDGENPETLYSSGAKNDENKDSIIVHRSTDTGDSWQFFYSGYVGEDRGFVMDMVKYKNKLIFYTRDWELFELDLETQEN